VSDESPPLIYDGLDPVPEPKSAISEISEAANGGQSRPHRDRSGSKAWDALKHPEQYHARSPPRFAAHSVPLGVSRCTPPVCAGRSIEGYIMRLTKIALATAFAISTTMAFAQGGGAAANSAAIPENSGPATNAQGGVVGKTTDGKTMLNNGATTGTHTTNAGVDRARTGNPATPKGSMTR
jgi:hypothetical protein